MRPDIYCSFYVSVDVEDPMCSWLDTYSSKAYLFGGKNRQITYITETLEMLPLKTMLAAKHDSSEDVV